MSETIKQRNVATDIPNEKEDAVAPALEEDIDDIKKVYCLTRVGKYSVILITSVFVENEGEVFKSSVIRETQNSVYYCCCYGIFYNFLQDLVSCSSCVKYTVKK